MNIHPDTPHFNLIASIDSLLNGKAIAVEYIPPSKDEFTHYTVLKLYLHPDVLVYAEEFEGIAALLGRKDKQLIEKNILIVVYIPISEQTIEHLFSLDQLEIAGQFQGQIILNFSDFVYQETDARYSQNTLQPGYYQPPEAASGFYYHEENAKEDHLDDELPGPM